MTENIPAASRFSYNRVCLGSRWAGEQSFPQYLTPPICGSSLGHKSMCPRISCSYTPVVFSLNTCQAVNQGLELPAVLRKPESQVSNVHLHIRHMAVTSASATPPITVPAQAHIPNRPLRSEQRLLQFPSQPPLCTVHPNTRAWCSLYPHAYSIGEVSLFPTG